MGAEMPKRNVTTANNLQVMLCVNSVTHTPTGTPFRKEKGEMVFIPILSDLRNGHARPQYERRSSHGLVLGSFYTFSKAIDQCDSDSGKCTGVAPVENRSFNKGRAGFDQNYRFVTRATFDLPLGAGKRFLDKG